MSTPRRRGFQEVRDNLLTAITGGVAAEAHPFPPPGAKKAPYRYSLQRPPVSEITSVYGSRDREPHLFRSGVDYRLLDDQQTLEWPAGGETPDPGSVFEVNYRPKAASSVVTDIYTGSVVRTVTESVALEIARLYAQLDAVYSAAFIDTATGRSLENLVRLLDLERVPGGRAAGEIVFERSPGSKGSINIPAGTRVMTEDGALEYETITAVTLSETQTSVRVQARDVEPNDPVAAATLTVLPVPIAGIGAVSNPVPTAITTRDESDEELRARAKTFLHGSERGTLGAIRQALTREGLDAEVTEVFAASGGSIDRVEITPHAEALTPELTQRVLTAIERVRPAGIVVHLNGPVPPKTVDLALRLASAPGLLEQDLRAVHRSIQAALADYFTRLGANEPASINRLVGLVLSNEEVEDVTLLSATLHDTDASGNPMLRDVLDRGGGRLTIGADATHPTGFPKALGELKLTDPGLPTRIDLVITVPADALPPNADDVRTHLGQLLAAQNTENASEPADGAPARALSFAALAAATPLPGVTSGSADPAPFSLQYFVTPSTGVSQILASAGAVYTLTPLERLSLSGVELQQES
jgi:hypothetical protein